MRKHDREDYKHDDHFDEYGNYKAPKLKATRKTATRVPVG